MVTLENSFSFRMFDLYRRFVQILQINQDYFEEFRTGFPSEETCRAMIAKTFLHRQSEEKILELIDYLRKNALIIAGHAENIPETWDKAIKYTNYCISEIKKYLKRKGISFKSNFESMTDIPEKIGKILYKTGANPKQLRTIAAFLKDDLQNPKRTIMYKQKIKEKILSPITEEEQAVKIDSERFKSAVTIDVHDESNEAVQTISPINNHQEYFVPQSVFREDLLKTEFPVEEIEDLLQPQGHLTTNELLHIASSEESNEFVSQINDISKKSNKTADAEDIKSILESSKCESDDSEFQILEVNRKNDTIPSNYCSSLKRKNSPSNEPINCVKKFFITNKGQYITVTNDDNIETNISDFSHYVTVNTNDSLTDTACDFEIIEIGEDDSISEFNIINYEINTRQDTNNNQSEIQNKILDAPKIKKEIKEQPAAEIKQENGTCTCKIGFENFTPYIEKTAKYSDVINMTYAEVLEMMDKIMAFCELKHEIALEEFLILRRTRDKIHLGVENEKNKKKLLK